MIYLCFSDQEMDVKLSHLGLQALHDQIGLGTLYLDQDINFMS